MTVLKVLTYPEKSLKEVSVPVLEITADITQLVQDMFETMIIAHGIGLAAPQVGNNITLFVMDVATQDVLDSEKLHANPLCFINPKIIKKEGSIEYEEGCLSCPDLLVTVTRAEHIVVEALNEKGEKVIRELSDLEAICAQHEMDHLQGILLADHVSRLKRDMYRKQMIKRKKEEQAE